MLKSESPFKNHPTMDPFSLTYTRSHKKKKKKIELKKEREKKLGKISPRTPTPYIYHSLLCTASHSELTATDGEEDVRAKSKRKGSCCDLHGVKGENQISKLDGMGYSFFYLYTFS